jgi:predicted small lipoprotein YifL
MRFFARSVLLLAGCGLLAACGNRGPLTLPPKPQAAKTKPAPAPAEEQAAPDNNSTAPTSKQ